MLLYYDPVFELHDTGEHPENAGRIMPAVRHLQSLVNDGRCLRATWPPAGMREVTRCHSVEYVASVKAFVEGSGTRIESDTVVCPKSYDVALMAVGAVCNAVREVATGNDKQAFCLVRPPGHHALHDGAMGFCLFNNIAVGARLALTELGMDRVLIVDWDVHHGNGTQNEFWQEPRVGYLSIHRSPFYPWTGAANEVGDGPGLGTTMNIPIAFGTSRADYLSNFRQGLDDLAKRVRPQLVLVSAGFDSHRADPIGSLGLESEDFSPLTRAVLDVANQYADGRVIAVLEGGYHPVAVAESIAVHLEEMLQNGER